MKPIRATWKNVIAITVSTDNYSTTYILIEDYDTTFLTLRLATYYTFRLSSGPGPLLPSCRPFVCPVPECAPIAFFLPGRGGPGARCLLEFSPIPCFLPRPARVWAGCYLSLREGVVRGVRARRSLVSAHLFAYVVGMAFGARPRTSVRTCPLYVAYQRLLVTVAQPCSFLFTTSVR